MARRPKVFCWSDGLRTFTVAATSRAKALEAWGVERDLFKNGGAREITEGAHYEAAAAQPGQVLERRLEIDPGPAPKGKARPKSRAAAPAHVRTKPAQPSKEDLARAARLEKALTTLEARQEREARAADQRVEHAEQALDEARDAARRLRQDHRKARDAAEAELAEARDAIRSTG